MQPRQLRDDLRVMRNEPPIGYSAPIICDRTTGYYTYEDVTYSISKSPLAEDDLEKLNEVNKTGMTDDIISMKVMLRMRNVITNVMQQCSVKKELTFVQGKTMKFFCLVEY